MFVRTMQYRHDMTPMKRTRKRSATVWYTSQHTWESAIIKLENGRDRTRYARRSLHKQQEQCQLHRQNECQPHTTRATHNNEGGGKPNAAPCDPAPACPEEREDKEDGEDEAGNL